MTVREQLHLIPEDQMKKTDTQSFGDYAYCPIKDSRSHPKNAKIQFVVLILDKPQVKEGKRLTWSVADRTGVVSVEPGSTVHHIPVKSKTNACVNRRTSTFNTEARVPNIPGIGF